MLTINCNFLHLTSTIEMLLHSIFVYVADCLCLFANQIVIKKARDASEITESGTQRITEYASRGFRALGVAKGSADGPISGVSWEAIGLLPLYDPPRHDTGETIRRCIEKVRPTPSHWSVQQSLEGMHHVCLGL